VKERSWLIAIDDFPREAVPKITAII
jgi:hypothetical protein